MLTKKSFDNAIVRYDDVKAVLQDGKDACGVQFQKDKAGEEASDRIEKRVTEKSDSAKRQRNNDSDKAGDTKDDGTTSDTKSTEKKLDELNKKATDAQKARAKRQQSQRDSGSWDKSDRKYDDKNW